MAPARSLHEIIPGLTGDAGASGDLASAYVLAVAATSIAASLLGLGGLGFFILDGLRRSIIFPTEIIVGVILSVALAALLDLSLLALGRALTPWVRRGAGATTARP